MVAFAEKLAAAKAVSRPFKDVTIALRAGDADARAELEQAQTELQERFEAAQVEAAKDRRLAAGAPALDGFAEQFTALAERELELDQAEADHLITLRFWEIPGEQWADLTVKHPPRAGVLADLPYGYNLHAAAKAAAPVNGRLVEDDGSLTELTPDQWADLWDQLPGRSFGAVADAIYALNEYEPEMRVERLKKVSRPLPVTDSD